MPDPIGDFYRMVKGVENAFPIPAPTATVRVGSFNAGTGAFEGLCSTTEWQPADREHHKPWKKTFPPSAQANGVNAILEFEILGHSPAGTRVTANGVTVRASPGQRVVSVDVKNATRVDWRISSRVRSYHDRLLLTRPPIVGAGVFTLPALPVAIIYEPPADRLRRNSAKYTANQIVGTTTRTTFSQEHSTTTPGHSEFCSITDMTVSLQATAKMMETVGHIPYAKEIASALKLIADGLGKVTATQTYGSTATRDGSVALLQMSGMTVDTSPNDGGPGLGDIIYYVRNARVVWLARGGQVSLALLDADTSRLSSTRVPLLVENNPTLHLAAETARALANLDPFVTGGPEATLPPDRFVRLPGLEKNGDSASTEFEVAATITQADREARANFGTHIEDRREGWLSFLGIAVPRTETIKATSSISSSTEVTSAQTSRATVKLWCEADEFYAVDVYFDRIFGTFATKMAPQAAKARIAGRVVDAHGVPAAGQMVTLETAGRSYTTWSNAQGLFSFRSSSIRSGPASLCAGPGVRVDISLQLGKTQPEVEIRLH